MRPLHDLSIRRKLTLIVMVSCAAALLLACAAFIAYDRIAVRREMVGHLKAVARTVSSNIPVALTFRDQRAAREVLSGLIVQTNITAAAVYDESGRPFVTYRRPDLDLDLPWLVLAALALAYLAIGLYTLWRAAGGVLFYLWCLASAVLFGFSPVFPVDRVGAWVFIVDQLARLLLPPLTLHLFLSIPRPRPVPAAPMTWGSWATPSTTWPSASAV